ncbi:MAG: hypothetical protein K2Y05_02000 [Hyphomicrobiaceae bacterium]|nr:hypothetical protein [Hyphomicrobiaceae bacterium]
MTATYHARMMSADSSGEGHYTFEAEAGLMKKTADEVVQVFFAHVEKDVLRNHVDWELNGVIKNKDLGVVTAMGSLVTDDAHSAMPFLVMISAK